MPNFVINLETFFKLGYFKRFNPTEQFTEMLRVNNKCSILGLPVMCGKVHGLRICLQDGTIEQFIKMSLIGNMRHWSNLPKCFL